MAKQAVTLQVVRETGQQQTASRQKTNESQAVLWLLGLGSICDSGPWCTQAGGDADSNPGMAFALPFADVKRRREKAWG
jgi:hypothetical protein